jgi:predicted nicotinamide N-methyase
MSAITASAANAQKSIQVEVAIASDILEKVFIEIQGAASRIDRPLVIAAFSHALEALAAIQKPAAIIDLRGNLELAQRATSTVHATLIAQKQPSLDVLAVDVNNVTNALAECLQQLDTHIGTLPLLRESTKTVERRPLPIFRASLGAAALVDIDRPPIVALAKLVVSEEDLIEVEEIGVGGEKNEFLTNDTKKNASLPAPMADPDGVGASGETAMLRRLARELMEEVGTLGGLCSPFIARAWSRGIVNFEERLLAAFDALVALTRPIVSIDGVEMQFDVLGELLVYSSATDIPDPARAFARTFVLSCVEGEDCVRAALVFMRQAHSATYPAHRDAFIFGSNPLIGPAMHRLCDDGSGPLVRVALDVLTARREATIPVLVPLFEHPDAGVRLRAVRCLGVCGERNAALSILAHVISDETDSRIVAAAMRALVRRGEPYGLESARRVLRENRTEHEELHSDARLELLSLLGIAGNASDGSVLRAALGYRPREAEALGWHGSADHVEPLLAALQAAESTPGKTLFCAGIARALARITGADIRDATGNPRSDSSAWKAYWAENRTRFAQPLRYRFGRPYLPSTSLDELETDGVATADREACVVEIDAITAGDAALDLRTWTSKWQASVNRLRSLWADDPRHADGSSFSPGEWVSSRWLRRGVL